MDGGFPSSVSLFVTCLFFVFLFFLHWFLCCRRVLVTLGTIVVLSRFIPIIPFFTKLVFVLCFVDRGLCIGLPAAGDSVGIDSKPAEAHARLMNHWFFRQ